MVTSHDVRAFVVRSAPSFFLRMSFVLGALHLLFGFMTRMDSVTTGPSAGDAILGLGYLFFVIHYTGRGPSWAMTGAFLLVWSCDLARFFFPLWGEAANLIGCLVGISPWLSHRLTT